MKTNVYHYQEEILTGTRAFVQIGTVVGDNITPALVWHLTNWSCWLDDEELDRIRFSTMDLPVHCDDCVYNRMHDDKGVTNHDIMFEIDGIWYTAECEGFAKFNTYDEAKQHLVETNY